MLDDRVFHLRTQCSSMVVGIGPAGHVEQWWWGAPLDGTAEALGGLVPRWDEVPGLVLTHGHTSDSPLALNRQPLAWSSHGKGDFRQPGIGVVGQRVLDFTHHSHAVVEGVLPSGGLPVADAGPGTQTLDITTRDEVAGLEVTLRFTTFPASGVITRRTLVTNIGHEPIVLDRLASFVMDVPNLGFDVVTLDGWWLSEAHQTRTPLGQQVLTNASVTGASSAAHNPGLLVVESRADDQHGRCLGFNLVYSGSHATTVEGGQWGTVRVVGGPNPIDFAWRLAPGETTESPEAALTFSDQGLNGVRANYGHFVDHCIVPERWRQRPRPVVFNHWEGTYFDYDTDVLLAMAAQAAQLGAEVFVLDDGWFGQRNGPLAGLGDWSVNTDKLAGGLDALARGLAEHGLDLGLWVEPESVNVDSDLYRAHPDWAIAAPGRRPSEGRHQLLLDLTRPEVRDHLVGVLGDVLDSAPISFVKWDMNRLFSDASEPGFHHRYVLGLYEVLGRVFGPRPHLLLETCSSGGNRFDLGMLRFGPQVWASDCTDPFQRLRIQQGHSLFYPASTISAHVSASPNHQTGRVTSVDFRFGVAAPYVLGIELDPATLDPHDRARLAERVAWYRRHREGLQFGRHDHVAPALDGRQRLAVTTPEGVLVAEYGVSPRPGDANGLLQAPRGWPGMVEVEPVFGDKSPFVLPGAALVQGVPTTPLPDGHCHLSMLRPAG